jgi:thiol-disulfide isomerase/thioredoxin
LIKSILILILATLPVALRAQTALDTAINFTVKDVDGVTHHLNHYLEQGELVVIDFFTITCGPCVTYAPEINAAYENFGCNGGNVVFLGINWGANNQQVIEFCNTYGAFYPAVSGLEGNGNHVVADYQVLSYPTVILIEPGGAISEQYIWPPLAQHIDSVIASYGGVAMPCNTGFDERSNAGDRSSFIKVFPNPASGSATVQTPFQGDISVFVVNVFGSVISQQEVKGLQGDTFQLSLNGLIAGYYQVVLKQYGMIIGTSALVVSDSR